MNDWEKELEADKALNIETCGDQRGFYSSLHYHRYEATPYGALEYLWNDYSVDKTDTIVDYGCGKGRFSFSAHHNFQATVIGIEMNKKLYETALDNRRLYLEKHPDKGGNLFFHCGLAEEYEISSNENRFYFFNPFSVQIFMKVINNILQSVEKKPRHVELILYYSSVDFLYYLDNDTMFELKKEIIVPEWIEKNEHEKFSIFQLR
ncbi:methyltransferase domain-containing protein [Alkalihalobacillus sp. LMS39]|uniref:methyltransferase domain-containing protein n=1 Tax=Alkalihalobacillus sp. LMS39 TaxID=2924032 RepID=UPI001FB1DD88|nr:methyltransferase domain-containing protein [Alkalihalobacillus sp. LMS39]UOE94570.1 class I SAM-dependent methyltransferase [Alkalihalobacillus sp. LMS39]